MFFNFINTKRQARQDIEGVPSKKASSLSVSHFDRVSLSSIKSGVFDSLDVRGTFFMT